MSALLPGRVRAEALSVGFEVLGYAVPHLLSPAEAHMTDTIQEIARLFPPR
ncbi:hypothetical protein ACPZ19_42565 [Amycolatopsis lurida]